MSLYTADWIPLTRNVYYRKTELYDMSWGDKVHLADNVIAAAQFGGPIAVCRNEKKLQKVYANLVKPTIIIYSSSGSVISHIKWESGKLVHLAWSSSENLLCISENGDIYSYDVHGKNPTVTSMGMEAKDCRVLECRVFTSPRNHTGVAVLTGAYHIFFMNNIQDPRVREMAYIPGLVSPPGSWEVVTDDRTTKIILAKDSQIFVLDQGKEKCALVPIEFDETVMAITEIAVSLNHEHIALYTDNGHLWFGSANLEKKHCELDTKRNSRPHQLMWCGNSAVVGVWRDYADSWIVIVFGLNCHLNYSYCSPIHLVPEIDCLRIISDSTHELLQKVPDAVADVFRIGSVSPSALLLEASKEFQSRNHKADEYMRMIREKNELEAAVRGCMSAAGHEFDHRIQKMLLRAASYGKAYLPDMDFSVQHVAMCKTLRILNAVRRSDIGIPLTYTQLEYLTLNVLLDRLVFRHRYPIAVAMCQYMALPELQGRSRVLYKWACSQVSKPVSDPEATARHIANKLGFVRGISYSQISNIAMECGHTQLSVKLLDYETRTSQQVPLLIKLEQVTQAMNKAIESGDPDLIFTVIFHMKETQKASFHREILRFPEAYSLYLKFCKEQDLGNLRKHYYEDSNYSAEAECHLLESGIKHAFEQNVTSLLAAADSYKKAKNEFASQVIEDQVKLLRYQVKLKESQASYVGLSVNETIRKNLRDTNYDKADSIKKEFKVPDRRFWWIKMTVLAENKAWLELEKFSKSRKLCPIGFEPFVDVCMKYNNSVEAKKYLPKVKDENKIKYCIKVGMLEEAARAAFEQKDTTILTEIYNMCGIMDRTLSEKIMTMKSQLGSKR